MRQLVILILLAGAAGYVRAVYDFTRDWYEYGPVNQGWGNSAATVGDVNGDGYSDILVGASEYDLGGLTDEGQVFLYYGGPGVPSSSADWTWGPGIAGGSFGYSVAPAGDMNDDGYDDFVVGAPTTSNGESYEGRVYFFLGGPGDPSYLTHAESNEVNARLGTDVAWAGDVNGDGFDDVIAGAPLWGDFGSPFYIPEQGSAYVYHGGASGPDGTPDWSRTGGDENGEFGAAVAGLGDVDGDGYADVMVGQPGHDPGIVASDHGRIFAYRGSAGGLETTPSWNQVGDNPADRFGSALSFLGDCDGDGFADALIGVGNYDGGVGAVYVALGSATGLGPAVLVDSGPSANFGADVAGIGDFNGDLRADYIVGGSIADDVWIYFGSQSVFGTPNPQLAYKIAGGGEYGEILSGSGDVNGDGFHDFLAIDPIERSHAGALRLYYGGSDTDPSPSAFRSYFGFDSQGLGTSIAAAGDVNGDGLDDLLLGGPYLAPAGAAWVLYGYSTVPPEEPGWGFYGKVSSETVGETVATAGDVNGDGYADILVGDPGAQEVKLFHGGPTGPSTTADLTLEIGELGVFGYAGFGRAIAGAGDLNGDGFADVAIGAPLFSIDGSSHGLVRVFFGSVAGIRSWNYIQRIPDPAQHGFGASLAFVGDVDGDGFDELAIGIPGAYGSGEQGAFGVLFGDASGSWGSEVFVSGTEPDAELGDAVAAAGDMNGDGYADFVVSEPLHDQGGVNAGRVHLYLGGPGGIGSPIIHAGTSGTHFGWRVAGLGDPDGLGRGMIVASRLENSTGQTFVELFELSGSSLVLRSARSVVHTYPGLPVAGVGDIDGDGAPDVGYADPNAFSGDGVVKILGPITRRASLPPAVEPHATTQAGEPIALRGLVDENAALRLAAVAWVPAGRIRVALEWQAGVMGQAWSTGKSWADPTSHIAGTPLEANVPLSWSAGDRVGWRLRIRSRNPFVPSGPWRNSQPNVASLYSMYAADTVTAVEPPAPVGHAVLGPPTPNPFNPATTLQLSLPVADRVSVRIVDAAGRRVRGLFEGDLPVGVHAFVWDGRDDRGQAAASGVYFATVRGREGSLGQRKLVLVK